MGLHVAYVPLDLILLRSGLVYCLYFPVTCFKRRGYKKTSLFSKILKSSYEILSARKIHVLVPGSLFSQEALSTVRDPCSVTTEQREVQNIVGISML